MDLDPGQRIELANLLSEFSDVFAASPSDLGRTDVVRHERDTGGPSDNLPDDCLFIEGMRLRCT